LPPFLKVLREVTNEKNYETWNMANKDYVMPEEDVIAIQQKLRKERDQEDLNYSQARESSTDIKIEMNNEEVMLHKEMSK